VLGLEIRFFSAGLSRPHAARGGACIISPPSESGLRWALYITRGELRNYFITTSCLFCTSVFFLQFLGFGNLRVWPPVVCSSLYAIWFVQLAKKSSSYGISPNVKISTRTRSTHNVVFDLRLRLRTFRLSYPDDRSLPPAPTDQAPNQCNSTSLFNVASNAAEDLQYESFHQHRKKDHLSKQSPTSNIN
jgi:hypothetical protein